MEHHHHRHAAAAQHQHHQVYQVHQVHQVLDASSAMSPPSPTTPRTHAPQPQSPKAPLRSHHRDPARFPPHIIDRILDHVVAPRDLYSCAQVSAAWARAASRRLYLHVDHPAALRNVASFRRYTNFVARATVDGTRIAAAHANSSADWFASHHIVPPLQTPSLQSSIESNTNNNTNNNTNSQPVDGTFELQQYSQEPSFVPLTNHTPLPPPCSLSTQANDNNDNAPDDDLDIDSVAAAAVASDAPVRPESIVSTRVATYLRSNTDAFSTPFAALSLSQTDPTVPAAIPNDVLADGTGTNNNNNTDLATVPTTPIPNATTHPRRHRLSQLTIYPHATALDAPVSPGNVQVAMSRQLSPSRTPSSPFTANEWTSLLSSPNLRSLSLRNLVGDIPSLNSFPDISITELVIDSWRVDVPTLDPIESSSQIPDTTVQHLNSQETHATLQNDNELSHVTTRSLASIPLTQQEIISQTDAIKSFVARCPMLVKLTLVGKIEFSLLEYLFNQVTQEEYLRFFSYDETNNNDSNTISTRKGTYYYDYNASSTAMSKESMVLKDNVRSFESSSISTSYQTPGSSRDGMLDWYNMKGTGSNGINGSSNSSNMSDGYLRRALSQKMIRPSIGGNSSRDLFDDNNSSTLGSSYKMYTGDGDLQEFLSIPRNRLFANPMAQIVSLSLGSIDSDLFEPVEVVSKAALDGIAMFPNIKHLTLVGCILPFRYDFDSAFSGKLETFIVSHCTAISFLPKDLKRLVLVNTHMSQSVFNREMNPESGQRILRVLELRFSQLMLPDKLPNTIRAISLFECPNISKIDQVFALPLLNTFTTRFCRGMDIGKLEGAQQDTGSKGVDPFARSGGRSLPKVQSSTTNYIDESFGDTSYQEQDANDAVNSIRIVTLKSIQARRLRSLQANTPERGGSRLRQRDTSFTGVGSTVALLASLPTMHSPLSRAPIAAQPEQDDLSPQLPDLSVDTNVIIPNTVPNSDDERSSLEDGMEIPQTPTDTVQKQPGLLRDGGILTDAELAIERYGFPGKWIVESCSTSTQF